MPVAIAITAVLTAAKMTVGDIRPPERRASKRDCVDGAAVTDRALRSDIWLKKTGVGLT
jgi:hypothetical protein